MSFIAARRGPDFALVAGDTRHMVSRDGVREEPLDLGGKLYPMPHGWGVCSADGDAFRVAKLQTVALQHRADAADPLSIRDTIRDVWEREAGGVDDDALAGHYIAATNGSGTYGIASFGLDGREEPAVRRSGVVTSLSYGMADRLESKRRELLDMVQEGEDFEAAADAAVRAVHRAAELAYDVSNEALVAGVYAGDDGPEYAFRKVTP